MAHNKYIAEVLVLHVSVTLHESNEAESLPLQHLTETLDSVGASGLISADFEPALPRN